MGLVCSCYWCLFCPDHQADAWLTDKLEEVQAEQDLDALYSSLDVEQSSKKASSSDSVIVFDPSLAKGEIRREGQAIYRGSVRLGKISYFLHWSPACYLATCECHESCYVTAGLTSVSEDTLIQWVGDAAAYKSSADHMAMLPHGVYKHRKLRA